MKPYRLASDRRSSPAWTVHARVLSTSKNWWECQWYGLRAKGRRSIMRQRWVSTGVRCTGCLVSPPKQHCRRPVETKWEQRQVSGRQMSTLNVECRAANAEWQSSWHWFSKHGIACWGQSRSKFRDLWLTWRVDEVGPDLKCWCGQLMKTTRCRTLEQVGLAGVQLQTVGQHPSSNNVDTCWQAQWHTWKSLTADGLHKAYTWVSSVYGCGRKPCHSTLVPWFIPHPTGHIGPTLQRHRCLTRAATSASSQVNPIFVDCAPPVRSWSTWSSLISWYLPVQCLLWYAFYQPN